MTLGGNLSVSAGPFGRTAEASASVGHVAPIFSYSKSKGLFAGVSIEGSAIFERKDANAKFYRRAVTAKEILSGAIDPPFEAEPLYRAIVQRIAASVARQPAQALQAPPVYNEINPINAPLQSSNSPVPAPLRAPPPPPPSNRTILAKALYDYAGQPGDLSFTTGDIITVTDQRPNSEWWRGSLAGNEGEFPSNYAQLIQQ